MDKEIKTEKDLAKDAPKAEAPKAKSRKELRQEAIASKFAEFSNVAENKLRSNSKFGKMATEVLNDELGEANLVDGGNPSAKYLVQNFEASPNADLYAQIIAKLSPAEEFIAVGKGAEYNLRNGLAVNKLDYTKFIPQMRNDIDKYTYWDTIDLPSSPSDFDKVELSIAMYPYLHYFLSGKLDELINLIKGEIKQAFVRNQAKKVLELIQTMFRAVHAKTSSTTALPTNRLTGTTTLSQVDAVKEFLDFIYPMSFDNVQFNYGSDSAGVHSDFTDAYNSCSENDRVYICEYQTYNNLKKYATTFLSTSEVEKYFKLDKWIVLPTSIYSNATASPVTKGSISQLVTLSDTGGTRVAGAVMVIDRRAFKRVYNYAKETAEYYAPNDTTELFAFKNWAIKFLKWGQVAVYENSALESSFVVPTTTI